MAIPQLPSSLQATYVCSLPRATSHVPRLSIAVPKHPPLATMVDTGSLCKSRSALLVAPVPACLGLAFSRLHAPKWGATRLAEHFEKH
ncbi:unnamed protein product [Periconia digitata]|uniref:Uncharacterized protein n=1 Tax=Periconia digitata TaxID=1303443 RepID=A0A9W4UU48_9PLEO|nr:unnamed protein product [Periconia digitata]